jgi:hypothetical protein
MAKPKKQISQEEREAAIVDAKITTRTAFAAVAQAIGEETFGSQCNEFAIDEIIDYLEIVGDPADFVPDLKRIYGHAQKAYQTKTPSPERVFGLFDEIYEDE